jgi:hypothetical protein
MTSGRLPKYQTVEEMEALIEAYFAGEAWIESGDTKVFAPTVTGLAYALDMTRQGLCDYGEKDIFADTVRKAKQRVEIALEKRLYHAAPVGTIFNLKNNYGWRDKSETEMSGSLDLRDATDEQLDARISKFLAK